MSFFTVEDLTISFGGLKALDGINFTVNRGEVYAIIGPNGAGKTTLFNCINGIYKPNGAHPVQGQGNRGKNRMPSPAWASPAPSRTSSCSPI
jgi:ABC-type branched-subunit amino acid transport system ATPase component